MTPTLLATPLFENTACHTLAPEGSNFPRGGPSENCVNDGG